MSLLHNPAGFMLCPLYVTGKHGACENCSQGFLDTNAPDSALLPTPPFKHPPRALRLPLLCDRLPKKRDCVSMNCLWGGFQVKNRGNLLSIPEQGPAMGRKQPEGGGCERERRAKALWTVPSEALCSYVAHLEIDRGKKRSSVLNVSHHSPEARGARERNGRAGFSDFPPCHFSGGRFLPAPAHMGVPEKGEPRLSSRASHPQVRDKAPEGA